jgi:hypothetical protein
VKKWKLFKYNEVDQTPSLKKDVRGVDYAVYSKHAGKIIKLIHLHVNVSENIQTLLESHIFNVFIISVQG